MIAEINNQKVDENGYLETELLYEIEPQNYRRENKGRETRNYLIIK